MRTHKILLMSAALATLALPALGIGAEPHHRSAAHESDNATKAILLDGVVVTATRTETTAFEAPASISVKDQEAITREQGTTLKDILEDVPNVDFSGGASPYFQVPSIRGLGDEQTIIKIDGGKQQYNDNAGNARSTVLLDPLLLKQVEVLRGPSSTLHGSGGIGGVIAMRTKDAWDFLKPGKTYGATFMSGYQSADSQLYQSSVGYAANDTFGLVGSIATRDFGHSYTSDPSGDSTILNRDGYSTTKFVKATALPTQGQYLSLGLNDFQDYYHFDSGTWYRSKQQQVTGNYELKPADNDWIDLRATVQYTWRLNKSRNSVVRLDDTFDSWGGDLQNTSRFGPAGVFGHALTYGGDYYINHQRGNMNGAADSSRPKATGWDMGLFMQDEISLPLGFSLIPALRYTEYERKPDSGFAEAQNKGKLSPKVTANWKATDWMNLFTTYAESFRPPSLNEIYFAMDYPGFGAVVANPNLKPETAKTWEYGLGLSFDGVFTAGDPLRFKAVYFREDIKDFMEAVFLGGAPPNMRWTTMNVSAAHRFGYEAELAYSIDRYRLAATYGKVMGINKQTGDRVGQTPEQVGVRLGVDVPEYDLAFDWKSKFTGASRGYQPWNGSTSTVNPYSIHSFAVAWTPKSLWGYEGLRTDFGVDNLFDEKYLTYRGGYDRGRNVKLGVTCSF